MNTETRSMKFRAVRFPGSSDWHVQLSERPAVIFDVRSVMIEGREVYYLMKPYPSADEAEQAIASLIKDWKLEAGEWR